MIKLKQLHFNPSENLWHQYVESIYVPENVYRDALWNLKNGQQVSAQYLQKNMLDEILLFHIRDYCA